MMKFAASSEFKDLNLGFAMDEGQANPGDEFRVFYADRVPWHFVIKAEGIPGHGAKLYDNSAMENLMKSVELISRFRESQFDFVKAGKAAYSEVISVNPVYLKAGTPTTTVSLMSFCFGVELLFKRIRVFVFSFAGVCDEYAAFRSRSWV